MQPPPPPQNLEAIREAVHKLYVPDLRLVGHLEFYKPYPKAIGREKNPYPSGYIIPKFSLLYGEDGQSTLEHVDRFTMQCGELVNYENFPYLKLRLFPNSLTGATFTWYAILPKNSIMR